MARLGFHLAHVDEDVSEVRMAANGAQNVLAMRTNADLYLADASHGDKLLIGEEPGKIADNAETGLGQLQDAVVAGARLSA
jgi:hypothetical protein